MALFGYEAVDRNGKTVKGSVEAGNQQEASGTLRAQGLFVVNIKQMKGEAPVSALAKTTQMKSPVETGPQKRKASGGFFGGKSFSGKSLTQFTRQMATLLDAGLPIVKSLNVLENQAPPGKLKDILGTIKEEVASGTPFSSALEQFPKIFDQLYVNMIKAGETGGVLDLILERLASFREKTERLTQKIKGAMTYPLIITIVAVLIVGVIMVFVVPKFEEVFTSIAGANLPVPTLILINISRTIADFWYLVLSLPVILFLSFKGAKSTASGSYYIDKFKLTMPIFGSIIRKSSVARFCRTLGTLIGSGVPILDALNIIKNATGNQVLSRAVNGVYESIREGETIAAPMRESNVFDDIVVNMVGVGEETGELDKMLVKVADTYEYEVDTQVASLSSMIEPLMIVFMGVIVGGIVVALFLPIVGLIDQMSGGGSQGG